MLKAVIFDLDRTLLDRDASILSFVSSQFEAFRTRLADIDRETYISTFVQLDARGAVWKDLVYQQLIAKLSLQTIGWEELFADFDARIADYYLPFSGLHKTLEELAQSYTLGLITNGKTEFQNRTINALGIAPFFSAILISETEGVRKPDAEIFCRALQRLGVSASEAAYVGDHALTDMQAARASGMLALWKRNDDFSDVACDGIIDELSELPALLRS